MNIPSLANPRHLQSADDVVGSKHLRINDAAQAKTFVEINILVEDVFLVLHLGNGLLCT